MITLEVVALSPLTREWAERHRRRAARSRGDRVDTVRVGEFRPEDWDSLLAMYRSIGPAQGLPPLGEERLAAWVDELCRRGPSVVARAGRRVVGHGALVPDGAASTEIEVFVHPDYQHAGVRCLLVDALLTLAGARDAAPRAGILQAVARAWRRIEDALAELPWAALGPSPAGWVPVGRTPLAAPATGASQAIPPHAAREGVATPVPVGAGASV